MCQSLLREQVNGAVVRKAGGNTALGYYCPESWLSPLGLGKEKDNAECSVASCLSQHNRSKGKGKREAS